MGYCIDAVNDNITINDAVRFKRIVNELRVPPNHYGWCHQEQLDTCTSFRERANEWGFDFDETSPGRVEYLGFVHEKRCDDQDVFLKAIAPVVRDGSFIEFNGEDGAMFRFMFNGSHVQIQYGQVFYT